MNDFCLPDDYVENPDPEYFVDGYAEAGLGVSQPDVYLRVAELCTEYKVGLVVDVGCGHAGKLAEIALGRLWQDAPTFVGIDFGVNIEWCKKHQEWGRWIDHDLETGLPLYTWNDVTVPTVFVLADVIEHLRDPRPLLHDVLTADPSTVVISTPERTLTHGYEHHGPPPNPAHVREWAANELFLFLDRLGFQVARETLTRSDDRENLSHTILVECHAR